MKTYTAERPITGRRVIVKDYPGPTTRVVAQEYELNPAASQKIINHSPDGFEWAYHGSGPAQLALAICLDVFGKDRIEASGELVAQRVYQEVKRAFVANADEDGFTILEEDVRIFVNGILGKTEITRA